MIRKSRSARRIHFALFEHCGHKGGNSLMLNPFLSNEKENK
ncbi:MAG: hypothetical protein ACJAZW_001741 [Maritalea sp.]|jgi:hypothetical protein